MPKKHKSMKPQPMSPSQDDDENMEPDGMTDGMKKGGKVKKKSMKVEGDKMKKRLDKPARKASGGQVTNDIATDKGVSPTSPMAADSPQRKRGGKC